jgi:hypothetical protein
MREREREIQKLENIHKKITIENKSNSQLSSKNHLGSMTTLTNLSKNYLINKRDRAGAIRVVDAIGSRNVGDIKRAASELRGGNRRLLSFDE